MDHIKFTKESFEEFKKLYDQTGEGKTFMFQGNEIFKGYARYIIEYVGSVLASQPPPDNEDDVTHILNSMNFN